MMSNQLEVIQAWLQSSYNVQVPNDWLAACVEWIQQEHQNQALSLAQLQPMVFEQWLMSDLKDLGTSCLPANLPEQLSMQVQGPLALQVESMVDVGFPLYGQLQKVKGTLNKNIDVSADKPQQPAWEPKSSRMMYLEMTDGQTQVRGMEYQPIPAITLNLHPGFKVVIHGQVNCRRGVLLLTSENLQVLGGEVDGLMESNTPVAMLQRAMADNAADSGQSSKKTYSGCFIKRNTKQSGCQDSKNKIQTMTSSFPKLRFSGGNPGMSEVRGQGWGNNVALKTEPMTQNVLDDEWEEDLDYGKFLDEPMEEEPDVKPSSSEQPLQHEPRDAFFKTARERSSGYNVTAERSSRYNVSAERSSGYNVTAETPSGCSVIKSPQTATGEHHDNIWGDDDDDFDFAQADPDYLSPVIPVQNHVKESGNSKEKSMHFSSFATVCDKGEDISDSSSFAKSASQDEAHVTLVVPSSEKAPTVKTITNLKSSQLSLGTNMSSKTSHYSQDLSENSSTSGLKRTSGSSSETTRPPSAKQRKLTTMLTTAKKERNLEPNSTIACVQPNSTIACVQPNSTIACVQPNSTIACVQPNSTIACVQPNSTIACVQSVAQVAVDLTCKDEAYPTCAGDNILKEETQHTKNLEKSKTMEKWFKSEPLDVEEQQQSQKKAVVHHLQDKQAPRIKSESCQDAVSAEKTESGSSIFPAPVSQNDEIPKAVIAPFSVQGHHLPTTNAYQHLKDVHTWLQSSSEGHSTFTVKGYLTTLTDRLRSCQGDSWNLSCRITDGTATIEVAIDDTVLTHLIGFSAKESVALRHQARKDPKVKDILTEGLQKCQKALIEFSGLIDVQVHARSGKPVIINMVQLEKKKR